MMSEFPNPYPDGSKIARAFSTGWKAGRGKAPLASSPTTVDERAAWFHGYFVARNPPEGLY
jgi:ribosome modulation factor